MSLVEAITDSNRHETADFGTPRSLVSGTRYVPDAGDIVRLEFDLQPCGKSKTSQVLLTERQSESPWLAVHLPPG